MRAGEIVVVEPGGELLIPFFGVGVVADIGPLTQSGLNETFGFAENSSGNAIQNLRSFARNRKFALMTHLTVAE